MSVGPPGKDWWLASDGKWYPPEQHPQFVAPRPAAPVVAEPLVRMRTPAGPVEARSRQWKTWHVALIGVACLVIGLAIGAVANSGDTKTEVETAANNGEPSSVSSVLQSTATSAAAAPTTQVATTAAAAKQGSQSSPLKVGDQVTLKNADDGDIDVTVNSVDLDPWSKILKANQFNKPAPVGLHYVMVNITATYHAGAKKQVLDGLLFATDFSVFGVSNKEHTIGESFVVAPQPLDMSADLLDGGKASGNLVFVVEDNSPSVLLRVEESICFSNCDVAWFKIA